MSNLYELIQGQIRAAPGRIAIEIPDGPALTYADLDARCARLAGRLARLGVRRGDRSRRRSRRASRTRFFTSPACASARSTCRSILPTRRASSITSSAMPSRR
jgi:hypothetical protein